MGPQVCARLCGELEAAGWWLPLVSRDPEFSASLRERTCLKGQGGGPGQASRGASKRLLWGAGSEVIGRERGWLKLVGRRNVS